MFASTKNFVVYAWNFVFNHEVSPLRNIPDVAIRHYVLQALGLMWAVSFSLAIGSYTFLACERAGAYCIDSRCSNYGRNPCDRCEETSGIHPSIGSPP